MGPTRLESNEPLRFQDILERKGLFAFGLLLRRFIWTVHSFDFTNISVK